MKRRAFLLGLAASSCTRHDKAAPPVSSALPAPTPSLDASTRGWRLLEWTFASPSGSTPQRAVILAPSWGGPEARFPVVVALHGRGEALKGPEQGAMGWVRDYALIRAYERICAPPLNDGDFEGLSDPAHLESMNRSLVERPFGGLIIACPYLPDVNLFSAADQKAYGRFVIDTLLPRVRSETPALTAPESTGIDGVSLGGHVALRVGLGAPEVFGAVGALQPAIWEAQAAEWTELAKAALVKRPGLKLRLTTSHEDMYRPAIARTSEAWRSAGVPHDFADLPGPHDYVFNRGPGSFELLFWHDRVLARSPG
ncbi:MAG: alpha/beta hydrolase-fold protein [Polyangiaceae bacterium]